jgi:hypothetical protein
VAALSVYSTSLLFEDMEMGAEIAGPERGGCSRDMQSYAQQQYRNDVYWQKAPYVQCQNGSIMRYDPLKFVYLI